MKPLNLFGQPASTPRVELVGPDGERIPADLSTPDEYSVSVAFHALTDTGNYQLRLGEFAGQLSVDELATVDQALHLVLELD